MNAGEIKDQTHLFISFFTLHILTLLFSLPTNQCQAKYTHRKRAVAMLSRGREGVMLKHEHTVSVGGHKGLPLMHGLHHHLFPNDAATCLLLELLDVLRDDPQHRLPVPL
jgi:hypothetical protein